MQGYGALSDSERRSLWLGLRFSPLLCFAGIALGTALSSPVLLIAMAITALLGGFVTAKHPFDHLYDAALRPPLGGPSPPPSPPPRRFACQIATPWIVAIALAFAAGAATLAWVLAIPLAGGGGDCHDHELVLPLADLRPPAWGPGWRAEAPLKQSEHRRRCRWQTESE
jgi:Domain of unknown function (DUF4395)